MEENTNIMPHSVSFTDAKSNTTNNTWIHWHLIPSSRPVISRPTPVYKYVDVPGSDSSLDYSDYLIGRPTYSDCSGTFEFIYADTDDDTVDINWANRKSEISSFLDGREMHITLADDPDYYYIGRCYMKSWISGANYTTVTIEYRVRPKKYLSTDATKEVWA